MLNSNGNLITEENARLMIESGLDALYVGIDAFTEETYKKYRIGGELKNVVDNVLMYKELLKKYGSSNQKLFVQYVVMEGNSQELNQFIEFWKNEEIPLKIRPMVSWAGRIEAKNLDATLERVPCFIGLDTMAIITNGKVGMCAADLECSVVVGDITTQTIEEVWNGELKEFRRKHLNREFDNLPEFCRKCMD